MCVLPVSFGPRLLGCSWQRKLRTPVRVERVPMHMQAYLPNTLAYGHPVSAAMPLKWRGPESLRPPPRLSGALVLVLPFPTITLVVLST